MSQVLTTVAVAIASAVISGKNPLQMAVTLMKTFSGFDIARLLDHNALSKHLTSMTGLPNNIIAKLIMDLKMKLRSRTFRNVFGAIRADEIPEDSIARVRFMLKKADEMGYDVRSLDVEDDLGFNDEEADIAHEMIDEMKSDPERKKVHQAV